MSWVPRTTLRPKRKVACVVGSVVLVVVVLGVGVGVEVVVFLFVVVMAGLVVVLVSSSPLKELMPSSSLTHEKHSRVETGCPDAVWCVPDAGGSS